MSGGGGTGRARPRRPVPPDEAVAAFDSASALLLGLARALDGRDFPRLGQPPWEAALVRAGQLLPRRLRLLAYAVASGREGIAPERLGDVDLDAVAAWVVGRYAAGGPRSAAARARPAYPAVVLGSSNGALTHLAAACGVPWLPQTLLVPVARRADPADARGALDFGARHGPTLLRANPGVALHHMHDANQDALSASRMTYFRVKHQGLPPAYEAFLRERLAPGAPVVVAADASTWPVMRVGERHVFQLGAQGGMAPRDYLDAPGAPPADDVAAEAEWGLDAALLPRVRAWAERHGHPVVVVRYDHPQHPAGAVADVLRTALRARGEPAARLLVSSFVVHDAWRALATGSVPFWTFFPVRDAAEDLAAHLERADYDEVAVMLFNNGVRSRGQVGARAWELLARSGARRSGRLLGVDARAFPADFGAFARYSGALRSLPPARRAWVPLAVDDALAGLGADPRVTVERPDGS